MSVVGVVADPTAQTQVIRDRWQGPVEAGEAGAHELAQWMLAQGAEDILKKLDG